MGNKAYSLLANNKVTQVAAALIDKYGSENVTIHFQDTNNIVFSCPAISEKVIKMSAAMVFSSGDSWTSGSTIVNERSLTYSGGETAANLLILGDSFLLVQKNSYYETNIIAKLTNGESISICLAYEAGRTNYCYNLTKNYIMYLISFNKSFKDTNANFYKYNLLFMSEINYLVLNADYTPATIAGLYLGTYITTTQSFFFIPSLYVSPIGGYSTNSGQQLWNPITVEILG